MISWFTVETPAGGSREKGGHASSKFWLGPPGVPQCRRLHDVTALYYHEAYDTE